MSQNTKTFSWFVGIASAALAVLVVVLSVQNRALRAALARERAHDSEASAGDARFVPGERLAPLKLLARDGSVETLAFDGGGRGTLLLFYAETCNVCPQVFLSWEQLAPQFAADGVRVAAVQLDRTATSTDYGPPGVESFALGDFSRVPVAKIATVPVTLLVDASGVVQWVHYGTLTEPEMGVGVAFLGR